MTGTTWLNDDLPLPDGGMDVTHPLSPLNIRLRWEFLTAAEAESRRRRGRPLTNDELLRVLVRYPGNIGTPGRPLRR
jgi:hypothetical protein